ncbi:Heat shock protein DnaJ [Penicillium citrinum]|uniref:Heat shock protein DnaJ n=1 Tax=Penicillium citrinum TaxID=5077 RepID=A0A9W9PDB7_PENCI|nr:Heat shock protein DnaJ [Penicillium citrinum]KAJ5242253.1 Heat shock protein DnaJ [Penicillium citrinum]
MGQSQSKSGSNSQEQQSERKTDYYELLGLSRTATDDEIKKAYRKKALELHPDRNYGNVDEATRLFAEVQSAYEVLADPQERAWYDSHSDAFLGTTDGSGGAQHSYNIRITTAEDVLKVFSKFSPRMEFSDSSSGFYGGLQEQFTQLALEERLACEWENQEVVDFPPFGSKDSDFEMVVRPFYAVWSGFSTRKSFAWKDTYRLSEAPDRRVRRLMEKENRRLREEAIRGFNDAVRSLVAFIKKRDPRYQANALNEAQRQESLRQSVAAQQARSRAMNNAKMREHVLPEWARSEEVAASDEESSASEVESFECVACHKSFKSQNQYDAHEKSKKHIKAVKKLCREMRLEDVELDLDSPAAQDTPDPLDEESTPDLPADEDVDIDIDTKEASKPQHIQSPEASDSDEDTKVAPPEQEISDSDDHDDDYATRESVETRLGSDFSPRQDPITPLSEQLSSTTLEEKPEAPPIGKAKQKRAKKEAKAQNASQSGSVCSGCNANFPSKTKLFAHLQGKPKSCPIKID